MRSRTAFAILFVLSAAAAPAGGQQIRGRAVDDMTRQALAGATVTLFDTTGTPLATTATGADGFFRFVLARSGPYQVQVDRIGFVSAFRTVHLADVDLVLPAFVLRARPVAIDSIEVTATTRRAPLRISSGASTTIAGERLAMLERQGARMLSVLREIPGLHVREYRDRSGRQHFCVESQRRLMTARFTPCDWVAVVIDGQLARGDEENLLRWLNIADFESIEYLAPLDAGVQHGMHAGAQGTLEIWTRGSGPHVSAARNRK